MVALKLYRVGNSLGVVLPNEVVDHFRAKEGDLLFLVEAPDGGYRLTPYNPAFGKKLTPAEEVVDRYRNILQALAK